MDYLGRTTTKKGRVVYNHKPHIFNERAAARITRQALNFAPFKYLVWEGYGLSLIDEYAKWNFQNFVDYASRWNFFPRSMIEDAPGEISREEGFAIRLGEQIASYMGAPDWAVELGSQILNWFISSEFHPAFRLSPGYASMITQAVAQNTKTQGEIYGYHY